MVAPGGPAAASDVHGAHRQRLGHRGQREHPLGVAVAGQHAGGSDHRGGDGPDGPFVQSVERRHQLLRAM